jgi:hypothetical protein
MRDYLTAAILLLRPNSEFTISNDDYTTIVWHILEGTPPTKKQVDDEMARLKASDLSDMENKAAAKSALLARLGMTDDEAKLLLS